MNSAWILADAPAATPASPPPVKGESVNQQGTTILPSSPNTPGGAPGTAKKPGPDLSMLLMFAVLAVFMYFILFRGPRKRQQQQRQMIDSLKKNDRVQTIGGILGTVLDVKDNEVIIKIDESNNTKIRVIPSAISRVMTEEKS